MAWLLIFLLTSCLFALGAAAIMAPGRRFPARLAGVILVTALLVGVTVLFWRSAVMALAIASVCSLGVGVMFQRVAPGRAVGGAIGAFVLMFGFSWIAMQVGPPLLWGEPTELSQWLGRQAANLHLPTPAMPDPGVMAAIGAAVLGVAALLDRWLRVLAALVGIVLLAVFLPQLLAQMGCPPFSEGVDPNLRIVTLILIVLGVIALARRLCAPPRR